MSNSKPKKPDAICNLVFDYVEEYAKMSTNDRVSWAIGEITLAIGRGDIRGTMFRILERARAEGVYWHLKEAGKI